MSDISRRDFINGVAAGVFVGWPAGVFDDPPYPPTRTGLRGSHPGSYEVAHALRDGSFWRNAGRPVDTGERYDLVIVGGGISGLAAAYFYRQRDPSARILIVDNHDDFGGHAKRNEFHLGGRMLLMNGGTLSIDSPTPYSAVAAGLLSALGIDPVTLDATATDRTLFPSLGLRRAVFFDRETFGADRLVANAPEESDGWRAWLAGTPLSAAAQRDIARIETERRDYMPGLSSAEKKDKLSRISYRTFLLDVVKAHPDVIPFYQTATHGEWGVGIDAEPALDCWALGLPGFQGLGLAPGAAPRMSYTGAGYANGGSPRFHFPDGNASIARALVRSLIPDAVPGQTATDIVTARVRYDRLDVAGAPVRIRLGRTVLRVRNTNGAVEVIDADASGREQRAYTVGARGVVLACWNMMIPFLCPELPDEQKTALHYLVKVPLVYASIGVRDWTAWHRLGIRAIAAPGSYWSSASLNPAVTLGR